MNVLVVGAGIIGAAVADALARRGADVTVLDMRSPGGGASQASAGILAPDIEAHQDSPLLQLGLRSLDLFDAFVAGASERGGRQVEYARTGTLQIALGEDDEARLRAAKAWLDARGVANEWLDGAGVRSVEPTVTTTSAGGLLVPGHGLVGVSSLIDALVHSARFAGAVFESPVEVVDIEPVLKDAHVLVRADGRRYSVDAVVVASGSWSGRVRIKGCAPLPVRPVRGQLLHLCWPGPMPVGRIVWGPRCYTVPWSNGTLLVGATVEEVGFDERSTVAGVHDLMNAAGELLPAAWQAPIESIRVGLRPATPDGLPAIGPLAAAPRVTIATGHYRNGILLAPLTAAIVAASVLDGVEDPAMTMTSPDRWRA